MPVTADIARTDDYVLALEEARRALDEQERAVAHLSMRAGALLSAATIATSFLGAPVLAQREIGPAAWLALASFVAHGAALLSILRPRHEWQFSIGPAQLITLHIEPIQHRATPSHRIRREMALQMGASVGHNRRKLDAMTKTFNIACVLLAIEVLAWVGAIATTG